MEKVDPEFESERIREAGDTVTCFDEVLGYSFDARAMEFDRYPFEPKRGRVSLANFRELQTADYIFQATVGSKKAITYTTKNAVLKGVKYDDSLTLVDGMGMKVTDSANVERVRIGQIGPGRYGLRVDSGAIEITGKLPDSQIASAANWNGKTTLLTPSGIYTGTIQANQINTESLSAISANLGTVTAGQIIGVSINSAVITGSTIQTATSGRRIVMSDAFRSYDSNNVVRISIEDFPGFNYHQLQFFGQSGTRVGVMSGTDGQTNIATVNNAMLVLRGNPIAIDTTSSVNFQGVPVSGLTLPISAISGLQDQLNAIWSALNNKADKGAFTQPAGPYNGGIPIGTNLMTSGGGVVTWNGIPAHSHIQQ